MNLTEISDELDTSKQNVSQIASKGIKKLFKNIRKTYNLTYLDSWEMMLIGLDIYQDPKDVKYVYKHLDKIDKENLEKERQNFIGK